MVACSDDAPPAGSTAVPGVTDTTILVGSHQPLTGAAAPGYSKISPATKAYFEYVNKTANGVNGRKITYKYVDDGYNPSNTVTVVKDLVTSDKVFAILNGLGTPTHTGVLDYLQANKVPDLFVASGSLNWNQPTKYPYTFGWQTDYAIEGKIFGTYVKNNFAGKKTCHFGQADDFGRDHLGGLEKILGTLPAAQKQTYTSSAQPNIAPQITALKAAGCEVVVAATVPGFTALTLGTAAAAQFKPQWIVSSVGGDYLTLAGRLGAGTAQDKSALLEGVITGGYLPAVSDDSNPWIQLFKKINADYNGNAPWDGNVLYGMSVGYTFVQALQKAGKNLTREGIVAAVESGGFTGPWTSPTRYSKTDHSGISGLQLAKIDGKVQKPFGPIYTSDSKDAAVTEYTGAPTVPPANGIPTA